MGKATAAELARQAHERKMAARRLRDAQRIPNRPPMTADALAFGKAYGIGVGVYIATLGWLRLLFAWLAFAAIPLMVLAPSAKFTAPDHALHIGGSSDGSAAPNVTAAWAAPEAGVQVYPDGLTLSSITLAAVLDPRADGGALSWVNVKLPGMRAIGGVWRRDLLFGACVGVRSCFCSCKCAGYANDNSTPLSCTRLRLCAGRRDRHRRLCRGRRGAAPLGPRLRAPGACLAVNRGCLEGGACL
jgi:hypothetical protein